MSRYFVYNSQNTIQLMTAGMVHVTNLDTLEIPRSNNPSRTYRRRHQLTAAGMVHVTNRVTPGSAYNPPPTLPLLNPALPPAARLVSHA
jgi:hypothetical protein